MACENKTIPMKIGSSVRLNCIYTEEDGVTVKDLTGYTIDVDFINAKNNRTIKVTSTEDGSIVITDAIQGEYTIDAGISTNWPLGKMKVDIMYTKDGLPNHTEDFIIDFTQGRTQPYVGV